MISKKLIKQIEIDTLLFIIICSIIGVLFATLKNVRIPQHHVSSLPKVQHDLPLMPVEETTTWDSPDGQKILHMQSTFVKNKGTTYYFFTTNSDNSSKH